jgi:hypothetical protein
VLREVLRRAGEREGLVKALLGRTLQWDVQPERNRLLEAVAEAALAFRQGERDAGRRLGVALGRLHKAPNPGRGSLAPEAVRLAREALQGVLDGLTRRPPAVGTLAAGRGPTPAKANEAARRRGQSSDGPVRRGHGPRRLE